jgi:hypothetical protein
VVAPPVPLPLEVARAGQVADDPLCRPFGDVQPIGDVAHADPLVVRDQQQRLPVVREEREVRRRCWRGTNWPDGFERSILRRHSMRRDIPLGLPIQRDIDIGSLLAILVAEDEPGDDAPA